MFQNIDGSIDLMRIRRVVNNNYTGGNNTQPVEEDSVQIEDLLLRDRSLVATLSTIFDNNQVN